MTYKCRRCGKEKPRAEVVTMFRKGYVKSLVYRFKQCLDCKRDLVKQRNDEAPTRELREEVYVAWGRMCLCCKRRPGNLDHVTPVFLGGRTEFDNLQVLCSSCNAAKSNKVIDYRKEQVK